MQGLVNVAGVLVGFGMGTIASYAISDFCGPYYRLLPLLIFCSASSSAALKLHQQSAAHTHTLTRAVPSLIYSSSFLTAAAFTLLFAFQDVRRLLSGRGSSNEKKERTS